MKKKHTWRTLIALLAYALGVFGWLYIGVWQILKKPVWSLITAQMEGRLSLGLLVSAFIQGFLYLSLAGGVWCIGYMISQRIKDN